MPMRLVPDIELARRIIALAVPVILAMLSQTAINLLDTMMVGRLPGITGIDGVAGIGVSLPVFWALGGFLSAVAIGTQAITARRTGEGSPLLAGRALGNSLTIAVLTGSAISVLGYIYAADLFPFLNPHPNVIRLGSSYLELRMLGILPMVTTFSYKAFFDGIGKTHVHMVAAIAMNAINAGLNFLLIFGLLGFPRMEVEGAAWASVISSYVGMFIMFAWSLRPAEMKCYKYYRLKNLNRSVLWEITRLSVPSGLATVFLMSGVQFFLWVVGHIERAPQLLSSLDFIPLFGPVLRGLDTLHPDLITSASHVLISFLMLIFMPSMALGTATATLVGQSMGANKSDLAERYGWESVRIGMLFMGSLGILVILWPQLFLRIFIDKPEVIAVAVPPLRMMASVAALIAAALILTQALFGAGNTKFVMKAEFSLHLGCLVPLSYLLGMIFNLGILGTWLSAAIYVVLLASVMAWKFFQGTWKHIEI